MTRRRSAKLRRDKKQESGPINVLQTNRGLSSQLNIVENEVFTSGDISNVKPILDDDKLGPSTSKSDNLTESAAALHDELDTFRQRWKRELEVKREPSQDGSQPGTSSAGCEQKENEQIDGRSGNSRDRQENPNEVYTLAKKLFMKGVALEQDEMHHESIRFYKQAVHLCPDIEKQIFREQCEASLKASAIGEKIEPDIIKQSADQSVDSDELLPLLERIKIAFHDSRSEDHYGYCRPAHKVRSGAKHIANLPHDLIIQIFRYVIGKELDLASLESLGLVCRGFHILSHDTSLWRSICYATWSEDKLTTMVEHEESASLDWRQIYLTKPRVNCDGVYISRTKYIRQGDVGFQDLTYRPFHMVRYYRYLRFFPDSRVLILTTNEEPDKIIPIFRHALQAKQFSPELSILEGTYEFVKADELVVTAEKDFTHEHNHVQQQTHNQRRQARFHWSRQTPIWQKFNMRFELMTSDRKQFRNDLLKWSEYCILSRTELGQDSMVFDLSSDTFPVLSFQRVRKFNLRMSEPLSSH